MARIRSLKPEIWMSPQVMNLSHSARLLFIGLITQADDEGRGTADARKLKASIFGGDDVSSTKVRRWLDELSANKLVTLYEHESHGLLYELPSWKSHQVIDRRRPSAYPSARSIVERSANSQRAVGEASTGIGSDPTGVERREGIGGEGSGEGKAPVAASAEPRGELASAAHLARRGTPNGKNGAKSTEQLASDIRKLAKAGLSVGAIAKALGQFGVTAAEVEQVGAPPEVSV